MLELVVVLAILGLSLALVIGYKPPWSARLGLNGTAAEIAEGLRRARSDAILQNRPVDFAIDLAAHRFRIGPGAVREFAPGLSVTLLTIAGEKRNSHTAGIRFNPDGTSTGGRISLTGGVQTVAIGVDWLTGRVSIADVR